MTAVLCVAVALIAVVMVLGVTLPRMDAPDTHSVIDTIEPIRMNDQHEEDPDHG